MVTAKDVLFGAMLYFEAYGVMCPNLSTDEMDEPCPRCGCYAYDALQCIHVVGRDAGSRVWNLSGAYARLAKAAGVHYDEDNINELVAWTDDPSRTRDEILRAFAMAIDY